MERLNVGTKELVSVELTDRLGSITDLGAYTCDFKVSQHDGTVQVDWTAVSTISGMRVDCLLNTNAWTPNKYKLYVRPLIGSEQPIVGPFDFELI